ncbi:MAG: FMN-binding protein [Candidatus Eisenbacteria bacterium]|nr:FMN-binding protein [Candidatus Eisenbacteria bacterium]
MNGAQATAVPQQPPSPLRMILTLGMAGLFSGLILVGIYEVTLPMIKANQARALRQAVFQVVPGSEAMQKLVVRDGRLVIEPEGGAEDEPGIYAAYDANGGFLGYAIPSEGSGFQDVIKLIYGYDPSEKRVIGMQVLESRETPGLGDKIFKDQDFIAEFRDLAVEPRVEAVAKGTAAAPNEVDAITGATISSKAVVKIINQGNDQWLPLLPEQAPPLEREGS